MENLPYDRTDAKSIEAFAKKLLGKTFEEVIKELPSYEEIAKEFGDKKRKGGLGNLLEKFYFRYQINSDRNADFKEAGVELKVTPYEITATKKQMKAGERLVLTMIDYNNPIEPELEQSHLWEKCKVLLLIYYLRDKSLLNNLQYRIDFVSLFKPSEIDQIIIKNDYKIIANKIISGNAHELSEADTQYLGACTKGATAEQSIVPQYYGERKLAKKRAFCYKNSYMTYVLQNYLAKAITQQTNVSQSSHNTTKQDLVAEPILKSITELQNQTFEECIIQKIEKHIGKTDERLSHELNIPYTKNKAQWTTIVYHMLGISNNRAEEFVKANIVVKVIRLEENGNMRECMSFPTFKYKELAQEIWEDSTLHDYFMETKFLFVVFKKEQNKYTLKGCQFWKMPNHDLDGEVRFGWEKVVKTINDGVDLTIKLNSNGTIVLLNNFPDKDDNRIIHVRPHASKRYYRLLDGRVIGNGSPSDANELPDGTLMPNYCFWLNNTYVVEQLEDRLKK